MTTNFDKLNDAYTELALDVRNATDEMLELLSQIQTQSDDQGQVDALTAQLTGLAQDLKDSTDKATAQNPKPVDTPPPDKTDPATSV